MSKSRRNAHERDYGDGCENDSGLEPRGACDPTSKSVTRCALAFMLRCCARVHVVALVVDVVCLMLVLSALVVVHAVFVQFP